MNCGRREYQRREKFSACSQSYNGLKYRYILPGKSSGEDTVCKKTRIILCRFPIKITQKALFLIELLLINRERGNCSFQPHTAHCVLSHLSGSCLSCLSDLQHRRHQQTVRQRTSRKVAATPTRLPIRVCLEISSPTVTCARCSSSPCLFSSLRM